MKNSIAFLIVLNLLNPVFGQRSGNPEEAKRRKFTFRPDTLKFGNDQIYSRAIIREGKCLLIGTSKGTIIKYDERTNETELVTSSIANSPNSYDGEFRAVGKSGRKIIGMISGDNGYLITVKGNKVYHFKEPNTFMDDIAFHGNKMLVLGDRDSTTGSFYLKIFGNCGSITRIPVPAAIDDEACYAASASTVLFPSRQEIMFISGGKSAVRFHKTENLGKSWESVDLPMPKGEGCGPFSVHFIDKNRGMIVGGCYMKPNASDSSSLYTEDGGKTWKISEQTTKGYRSCVTGNEKMQFACGTNGIDMSSDGGKNWFKFANGNFCALLLEKDYLYATTNKGYILKFRVTR